MKKPAPWPAPGDGPACGPLSADHADEHIARAFRYDPVAEEIELKLERIRIDQQNRILLRETNQLERDQAELVDLAKLAEQLKRPKPEPQPELQPKLKTPRRQRGRQSEREAHKEFLRDLRNTHGGECKNEFRADRESRKGISTPHSARLYNTADDDLKAETHK